MKHEIQALLLSSILMFGANTTGLAQDKTVKIGVLSDQSGVYADLTGPGSTLAAQMGCGRLRSANQGLDDRRRFRGPPK
jgi:branched-chain amino acid transport system substrate-binding protein